MYQERNFGRKGRIDFKVANFDKLIENGFRNARNLSVQVGDVL